MKRLCLTVTFVLAMLISCAPETSAPTPAQTQAAAATTAPAATVVIITTTQTQTPAIIPLPTETASAAQIATPVPSATPSPSDTPPPTATPVPTPAQPNHDVEVLLLLSNRYGANYYLNRDDYERFGWHVTTTALEKSVPACAPGTTAVRAHRLLSEITDVTEYDIVAIMPASKLGSIPFADLVESQEARTLVASAADAGLPVYASCSGVRLLAAAGVIEGRQVIGEPRFKDEYEAAGATYVEGQPPPLTDGNIITARRGLYYHLDNGDAVAAALEALFPEGREPGEARAVSTQSSIVEQEDAAWTRTYGGPSADGARSVQRTQDGGFVLAGYTYSFGAGEADVYLIKTDAEGNVEWSATFGGPGWEYGSSVAETSDGGFVVAGYSGSFGEGGRDVYLIRTDGEGKELWSRTFGGPGVDVGESVIETSDDGLAIVGFTDSFGEGENDVYLIRIDANGNELWSTTFGGSGPERGESVAETSNGGFVLVGATGSFGAGNRDVYMIRTDADGRQLWAETFGYGSRAEAYDWGHGVQEASDGGFIVVGDSNATGASELMNLYLIRTDAEGNEIWSAGLGTGRHYDYGNAVRELPGGGYVATGASYHQGRNNVYAVMVDTQGNEIWSASFGGNRAEWGSDVDTTGDGGFVIAGQTDSFGAGSFDVWLIKVDG